MVEHQYVLVFNKIKIASVAIQHMRPGLLYKSKPITLLYHKPVVIQSPTYKPSYSFMHSPHTFTMKGLDVYI